LIWYFLMGMIAGAVGITLFAHWWIRRHMVRVTPEEMKKELEEMDDD